MPKKLTIGVDFDGTIVTHLYPEIGRDIGAIPVLKKLVKAGHKLILITMRHGEELQQAVNYLEERGVALWAVNKNPTQHHWTQSPKIYAQVYIDDAALGAPVRFDQGSKRFCIDWERAELQLKDIGVLPHMLEFVDEN